MFLVVLLILDALLLTTVVLMQAGTGGGLASMGGGSSTDTFMGGRQAVTLLTKMSWWCGGIFLGLCLVLAGLSTHAGRPRSVLEGQLQAPPTPVTSTPALPIDLQPAGDSGRAASAKAPAKTPAKAPAPAPGKKAPGR